MRRVNVWGRWLMALACMGIVFGGLESCMADLLRDAADSLNDTAFDIDGEPQTVGQWWDGLWEDDAGGDDFDDWWDDIWD